MSKLKIKVMAGFLATMVATLAWSKIPAPVLTEEAKAAAAEAAAKTAHGNKVADFQLCKSMDMAAANYVKTAKAAGKDTKPPATLPPCADPGPYVVAGAPAVSAAAPVGKPGAPAAAAVKGVPAKPAVAAPAKKS